MLAFLRATGPFQLNFVCKLLGHMPKMATTSIHAIFDVRSGAVVRVSDFGFLVRTPPGAPFVVSLSKSHLPPA